MIINLISSPRNISTALMYSFAQRSDTKVMDEPFYGYYLHKSGVDHPGRTEILKSQPLSIAGVLDWIRKEESKRPHLFIKNMAHHLIDTETTFLNDFKNVFLIRDPKQLITSFSKVIPNPTMQDIGIQRQFELYELLKDEDSPIIDSNILLENPRQVLTELCNRLRLSFDPTMLSWNPHRLPEDGVWAKYWYDNVHASSGFSRPVTQKPDLPEHCIPLYEASKPYFERLSSLAIKG